MSVFATLCLLLGAPESPPTPWAHVAARHPAHLDRLFAALDLEQPGLAAVKTAVEAGERAAACAALYAYYEARPVPPWLSVEPGGGAAAIESARAALDDTFTFYGQTGRVPRTESGGLDWEHRGPSGDLEWAWALNRQHHLRDFLAAFLETGDFVFARAYNAHVQDWVLANPYPGVKSRTGAWRGLEAHFRVRRWAEGFYTLIHRDALDPETAILTLASIPDHADYLRRFHAPGSNWIVMEMYALLTAGAAWPEFRGAPQWRQYAIEQMEGQFTGQVYSDGAQHELTSHYHRGVAQNFEAFLEIAKASGEPLPDTLEETTESMWNYLAYTMRPDGYGLMNNDSDRDYNSARVLERAAHYGRPDWRYIATQGAEGERPSGPLSRVFAWPGHVIMRSGWGAEADWAFFDIGPLGSNHWHRDKLHLSVMVKGRDVLVDGGRYTYVGGPWRRYFVGSASHNVLLIDGAEQKPYQKIAEAPVDTFTIREDGLDAWGTFDGGYEGVEGEIRHTRAVYYDDDARYWAVIDTVDTDRPRTVTALWHFHPDCTVEFDGPEAYTADAGAGNLRIVPAGPVEWQLDRVEGQEEPEIQGWWSREYNHKAPAPTAVYTAEIDGPTAFGWLLVASDGEPSSGTLTLVPGKQPPFEVDLDRN